MNLKSPRPEPPLPFSTHLSQTSRPGPHHAAAAHSLHRVASNDRHPSTPGTPSPASPSGPREPPPTFASPNVLPSPRLTQGFRSLGLTILRHGLAMPAASPSSHRRTMDRTACPHGLRASDLTPATSWPAIPGQSSVSSRDTVQSARRLYANPASAACKAPRTMTEQPESPPPPPIRTPPPARTPPSASNTPYKKQNQAAQKQNRNRPSRTRSLRRETPRRQHPLFRAVRPGPFPRRSQLGWALIPLKQKGEGYNGANHPDVNSGFLPELRPAHLPECTPVSWPLGLL